MGDRIERYSISLDLPGRSNAFILSIVKANPNVIVVNQSGDRQSPCLGDQVSTIVRAWYQGQEQGNCLANVLLGAVSLATAD